MIPEINSEVGQPTQKQLQEMFEEKIKDLSDRLQDANLIIDLKMKHPSTGQYMHMTTEALYFLFYEGYISGLNANDTEYKD